LTDHKARREPNHSRQPPRERVSRDGVDVSVLGAGGIADARGVAAALAA
jgi:NAD(P)H-dependent flavin oxidoreductase YrpB (nitropropane dioxygenase family)